MVVNRHAKSAAAVVNRHAAFAKYTSAVDGIHDSPLVLRRSRQSVSPTSTGCTWHQIAQPTAMFARRKQPRLARSKLAASLVGHPSQDSSPDALPPSLGRAICSPREYIPAIGTSKGLGFDLVSAPEAHGRRGRSFKQVCALPKEGWKVLASIQNLMNGLPPRHPRAVSTIGHEGLAAQAS